MSSDYLSALTNKKQREAGERYGINLNSYGFNRPGHGGIQKKDPKYYGKAVAAAANNDYDTRRTIEAAAMSGNKKAEKYAKNGFNDLTDVTKANNMFAKMHKRQGNGGDFSSNSDYAGLTYNMVQRDRNKMMESMTAPNQQKEAAEPSTKEEPYVPSKEMTDARQKVDAWESGTYNKGIYASRKQSTAPTSQQSSSPYQRSKGESQLDAFKSQLKERKNFQPSL